VGRIDSRHVRIIADSAAEERRETTRGARDYAALMQRGRTRVRAIWRDAQPFGQLGRNPSEPPLLDRASERDCGHGSSDEVLEHRLPAMLGGVVEKLIARAFDNEGRLVHITDTIERFYTDPAVSNSGEWDVELEVDHAVLPHTRLAVHLSSFVVRVRFRVRDASIKQLILDHRPGLKRRLEASMSAHGHFRDVDIDVD